MEPSKTLTGLPSSWEERMYLAIGIGFLVAKWLLYLLVWGLSMFSGYLERKIKELGPKFVDFMERILGLTLLYLLVTIEYLFMMEEPIFE